MTYSEVKVTDIFWECTLLEEAYCSTVCHRRPSSFFNIIVFLSFRVKVILLLYFIFVIVLSWLMLVIICTVVSKSVNIVITFIGNSSGYFTSVEVFCRICCWALLFTVSLLLKDDAVWYDHLFCDQKFMLLLNNICVIKYVQFASFVIKQQN